MTDPASYFVTVHCFGLALSESMSLYGILLKLLAVLALVAADGFFLASVFSLVSVRRSKLEVTARVGSKLAKAVLWLLDNATLLISSTQLGVTLVSLALVW